ncbi:hypothetical protein RCL1_008528 [Eukaryota sp. TZLM3-RCL]
MIQSFVTVDYGKQSSMLAHAASLPSSPTCCLRSGIANLFSSPQSSLVDFGKTLLFLDSGFFSHNSLLLKLSCYSAQAIAFERLKHYKDAKRSWNLALEAARLLNNNDFNETITLGLVRCSSLLGKADEALQLLDSLQLSETVDLTRAFCLFYSSNSQQI